MARLFVYIGLCLIVSEISFVRCQSSDYDYYDYGDPAYQYDSVHKTQETSLAKGGVPGYEPPMPPQAVRGAGGVSETAIPPLPLCCKHGEVYDLGRCILAPSKFDWKPMLDGVVDPKYEYNQGFPKCKNQIDFVPFYQKQVIFNMEGNVILPFYIQMQSIKPRGYCITKVMEKDPLCEDYQSQIFACIQEDDTILDVVWVSVSVSHFLLFMTILVFIFMSELRSLQGLYMICFVVSVLIYNICLLPGSEVVMKVGDSMCIAFGAVKYFFFCGIFLWFKIICFDVWRTIRSGQDIGSRKRFLTYSLYCWITAAILTVIVLVLPYTKQGSSGNSRMDPLREANYAGCKLRMGVNLILQIVQTISIMVSLVFLVLATVAFYGYTRFGNGLARHDASLCMKQTWKLFFLMAAHMISSVDQQFMKLPLPMYQYVLVESVTIFGVYIYRKAVIRWVRRGACFAKWINPEDTEAGSSQEKGQLTMT